MSANAPWANMGREDGAERTMSDGADTGRHPALLLVIQVVPLMDVRIDTYLAVGAKLTTLGGGGTAAH